MSPNSNQAFRLIRPQAPLPSVKDFDPHGQDLDAQVAWKHFGKLSLTQAYELFSEIPEFYTEDFVFMGTVAFRYYFPVIDKYLLEVTPEYDGDDCEAAHLGSALAAQLDWTKPRLQGTILQEMTDLAAHVRSQLPQYSSDPQEQRRIDLDWLLVEQKIALRAAEDYPAS